MCIRIFRLLGYNNNINTKWLIAALKQKLRDQFVQEWTALVNISSSSSNFRLSKTQFEPSHYLQLLPYKMCRNLLAFRTRNHRLPVEVGRWVGLPINKRKCDFCNDDIGDEFHFLFVCEQFKIDRKHLLSHIFIKTPKYY